MRRIAQQATLVAAVFFGLAFLWNASHTVGSALQNKTSSQSEIDASRVFSKNCATCHGKDGRAKTFKAKFNGARDLTDAAWQEDVSDERLFNSIMNGRGKMPAFKKKFSKVEIESLAAYVRQLKK